MLQELVSLAPETLRREPAWVVVAAIVSGIALWLAGGRFSRPMLAIAAAAAGGLLGAQLPGWCGWGVDAVLAGVAGAAVLGLVAFLLDQVALATVFGLTLAFWAGVAAWATLAPGAQWAWPTFHCAADPAAMGLQLWQICPADLRNSLPGAAGCALVLGGSLGMLWPRISRAIVCDLLGLSVIVAIALPAIEQQGPGRIASVLPGSLAQAAALAALFAVGLGVQWWLIRRASLSGARLAGGRRSSAPPAPRHAVFPGAPLPEHKPDAALAMNLDEDSWTITAPAQATASSRLPRMIPEVRMVA
jgi:hypothetical protein